MAAIEAIYADDQKRKAGIGDVVMVPGSIRGIVIAVKAHFITVLAIGTKRDTGETFVLNPRFIHDFPASDCSYLEKQTLNW